MEPFIGEIILLVLTLITGPVDDSLQARFEVRFPPGGAEARLGIVVDGSSTVLHSVQPMTICNDADPLVGDAQCEAFVSELELFEPVVARFGASASAGFGASASAGLLLVRDGNDELRLPFIDILGTPAVIVMELDQDGVILGARLNFGKIDEDAGESGALIVPRRGLYGPYPGSPQPRRASYAPLSRANRIAGGSGSARGSNL